MLLGCNLEYVYESAKKSKKTELLEIKVYGVRKQCNNFIDELRLYILLKIISLTALYNLIMKHKT